MHYLEDNDMDGLLLLVDFEKAFDSIEWKFLQKALNSFNFGPSICKWFETFYVDSKSCVINNGHISNFFNLERGYLLIYLLLVLSCFPYKLNQIPK
jgi:hypothetical protein